MVLETLWFDLYDIHVFVLWWISQRNRSSYPTCWVKLFLNIPRNILTWGEQYKEFQWGDVLVRLYVCVSCFVLIMLLGQPVGINIWTLYCLSSRTILPSQTRSTFVFFIVWQGELTALPPRLLACIALCPPRPLIFQTTTTTNSAEHSFYRHTI